jgi:pyruvate/2-oxoglutarate/acetoin dehydrogenase E1 component
MSYLEEVQKGMDLLASDSRTVFVGQAMAFKGHAISRQVEKYPSWQKMEFPVAENMQAGFCLGLAMEGLIPVCVYPRCNFAILACDQILNHIDKWKILTGQDVKVIIKMVCGSKSPMDPDWQHKANYAEAFQHMCEFIPVYDLTVDSPYMKHTTNFMPHGPDYVNLVYRMAFDSLESCVIVEDANLY